MKADWLYHHCHQSTVLMPTRI